MKKIISIVCAVSIAGLMVGCGNDDNSSTSTSTSSINSFTDTVGISETTIGNKKVVLTTSTNSEVVDDKYAYTTSDLGLISLVKASDPVKITDTLDDNKTNDVINKLDTKEPLVVSAKIAKKPISSQDKIVTILPKFTPKLPFDASVAVTNYKSLLALPNNGFNLLNNDYKPIAMVSSDIAFYDTNGKRIWDINKKFEDKNTTVSFYLIFDSEKSGLSEGNYTLATYKNGKYEYKDINITKKSDGSLTVALNGVYPFVIAKKGDVVTKNGEISNPYDNTSFKFAVVALDENKNVIGIGKVEENNLSLKAVSEPTKYQLVSYILKNNKVETNSTNIKITKDMLNSNYPLVDNMSSDDKNKISYYIKDNVEKNVEDISVDDFLNPQEYYCDEDSPVKSDELCNDFNITTSSLLNGKENNQLKEEYQAENNTTCKVAQSGDINNTTIKVSCSNENEKVENIFNVKTTDAKVFNFNFSLTDNKEGAVTNEKTTLAYVKDNNKTYVTNVNDTFSYNKNTSEKNENENYSSQYSKNYTTKINYINSKYVYNQTGSDSNTSTSTYYENSEASSTYNSSCSFTYDLSTTYDGINVNEEDSSKFSAKIENIQINNSSEGNITINGKKLAVTKDSSGYWYVNMSNKGF